MPTATASQTIGPYWHLLEEKGWDDLTRFGPVPEGAARITLTGVVTDGDGAPVADGCVEVWQADPPASDDFLGWGRAATDAQGRYSFTTLKPGPVPGRGDARQAPHIAITLLARGLLKPLVTRAYFAGEALNDTDPLLAAIEDPARRDTLLAREAGDGVWQFDIRLQGEGDGRAETVFLDV
ncbi:protocatechuate 3,4-dioxygenase alpha subunit [Humitalea rosea]|uniref:Protocatechuate 3,4-dioxygenase alpha subunit n=1 Tax=Humitalea rosea TaxID=990373 RepID=A0A2W7HU99_9PROT|nr:protocatechuate 3,4-dioxygenase subunit alpha [Humitalea rosea]PZW37590.1 protocatechuate 3,4-dioxygenase alpha subunit [Humitalea rosea]